MAQVQQALSESLCNPPAVGCCRAGFETCTIILEGKMEHRDSYGNQVHPPRLQLAALVPQHAQACCSSLLSACTGVAQAGAVEWHRPGQSRSEI